MHRLTGRAMARPDTSTRKGRGDNSTAGQRRMRGSIGPKTSVSKAAHGQGYTA